MSPVASRPPKPRERTSGPVKGFMRLWKGWKVERTQMIARMKTWLECLAFGILLLLSRNLARADNIEFACTGKNKCTGNLMETIKLNQLTAVNAQSVIVNDQNGPSKPDVDFTFDFNTQAETMSLLGTVGQNSVQLDGTLNNFISDVRLQADDGNLDVAWNVVPGQIEKQLGLKPSQNAANNDVSVIFEYGGGKAESVNLVIAPVPDPEPSSLLLLGSGLVVLGGVSRKRQRRAEQRFTMGGAST